MGSDDAAVVLLSCGDGARERIGQSGVRTVTVPARPERADLDPVLAAPGLRRVLVAGTDADLAAVLVRLLRTERLGIELAYLPTERRSAAARVWGLPHGRAALDLALDGVARPVPLVRDDAGGVLVGRGELRNLHGEVYCDEVLALRGPARRVVVTPWPAAAPPGVARNLRESPVSTGRVPHLDRGGPTAPPGGVAVRADRRGRWPDGRTRAVAHTARAGRGSATGRAVQVGCLPATLVHDGVTHPRPVTRWAWYRHVTDWLLVRG